MFIDYSFAGFISPRRGTEQGVEVERPWLVPKKALLCGVSECLFCIT
jgi:hypothetical protein